MSQAQMQVTPPSWLRSVVAQAALAGKSAGAKGPLASPESELVTTFAKKDPELLAETAKHEATLRELPKEIDTYEKLAKRLAELEQRQPPRLTAGIHGSDIKEEIKNNVSDSSWMNFFGIAIGGTLGWLGGWAVGAGLGWSLGTVLGKPLTFVSGDYLAWIAASLVGFGCAITSQPRDTTTPTDAELARHRYLAPVATLAASLTYFFTRPSYEAWQAGPGTAISSVVLTLAAALGASLAAGVLVPPVKQSVGKIFANAKARRAHRRELKRIVKAKAAFETKVLNNPKLWERLGNDTQRIAKFVEGPFRDYLREEKTALERKRDEIKEEIARLGNAKNKPVLHKESTPAAQRERLIAKFDRAIARLEAAKGKLEKDGIALIDGLLTEIPGYLGRVKEWETDKSDVAELAALEALASVGEEKADEAEIMLEQTRERLADLAGRFNRMLSDAGAARQAALEVERTVASGAGYEAVADG